jgi:dihydrofolate reductase
MIPKPEKWQDRRSLSFRIYFGIYLVRRREILKQAIALSRVQDDKKNMISIVASIDEKRGVGKNGDLLFKFPQDTKRAKDLTMGHPVIMGRRTYDSIPEKFRPLPGRTNIVVTRNKQQEIRGAIVVGSLEEAIEKAKENPGAEEIIVFGGGQIWKEAFEKDLVDVLHLTLVKGDYGADTFFPEYESKFTKVLSKEEGASGSFEYTFLDLSR